MDGACFALGTVAREGSFQGGEGRVLVQVRWSAELVDGILGEDAKIFSSS